MCRQGGHGSQEYTNLMMGTICDNLSREFCYIFGIRTQNGDIWTQNCEISCLFLLFN